MRLTSKSFLTDEEVDRINAAVREAELETSGEIVAVLATEAESYDRGLFICALMFSFLAVCALVGFHLLPFDSHFVYFAWELPIFIVFPTQVIALMLGYYCALQFPALHRAFIPHAYMQEQVDRAARSAFQSFRLSHTAAATGIMIYVSLLERMVVVLADRSINSKHDQATWDGVRDLLTKGLASESPIQGFEAAIAECGRILSKDFPIADDDTNELPNHLRMI